MSVKAPTYQLSAPHIISNGPTDTRTLQTGTFVQPLHSQYVPKHVLDKGENLGYDPKNYTFAYTHYGIVLIPKSIIIEV